MLALIGVFVFFFSSDFGLIDVEKTAIITGLAIDKDGTDYKISAQVAVPEATDVNSENQKALISGKGSTVGAAIKNLGDISGWYPKLSFCNLIIVGNSFADTNVIKILDYFAKTLRIQDSALVIMAEDKAEDVLSASTPLDNIASFAIQKVLLKTPGFDRDIASTDIKTFCSGHYSRTSSAYMPIMKIIKLENSSENSGSGGNSSSSQSQPATKTSGKNLLFGKTTALFKDGKKVGELDPVLTLAFNAITTSIQGTTIPIDDVPYKDGQTCNYLLKVMRSTPKVKLKADEQGLTLKICLNIFCKISDQNAQDSDHTLSENSPIPQPLKEKAELNLKESILELIETIKQTECDFLGIKEKLYRFNYERYSKYKDNYLQKLDTEIKVSVNCQR